MGQQPDGDWTVRGGEYGGQPHQPGAQYTASYTYDALNRLTSSPLGTYTYGDSAHLHAVTAVSGGSSSYTAAYNPVGEMTCRAPNSGATCAVPTGSKTGAGLGYNNEGQQVGWQNTLAGTPSTTAHAAYDGEGHRVAQQTNVSGTVSTTRYLAGGLEEVTTAGSTTTLTKYESVPGVCSVVIVGSGPTEAISYVATDGLGSTSEALDGSGNVTAQQLYGPYGGVRYSSGMMPTAKGYTGQYGDAATGLDYYGARYYDAAIGQFTSADNVDAGGLNRYAYVSDDPETQNDPSGHCWLVCAVIAAVAVAAVTTVGSAVIQQVTTGHVDWGQAAAMGVGAGLVVGAAIALGPVGVAMAEGGLAAAGEAVAAGVASDVAMTGAADVAGEAVATVGEKAAAQAAMGSVMGAGEGVTQGILAGHRGGQLLLDGEIGAVSGGIGGAAGSLLSPMAGGAIGNGVSNLVAQAATDATSGTQLNGASATTAFITGALTGELGAGSGLHPLPVAVFAALVDFGIQSALQQPAAPSSSPTSPWPPERPAHGRVF